MRSPGPEHNPPHPSHPHPREEPDWRGGLTTSRKQDPKGPDLFTMCPVAFDGNSIAPFVPSQRPGWGKREGGRFFFWGGKKKPGGVPGGWAECPSAPVRSGLGISSGVHRPEFPCPRLKKFPGFASCYSQQLVWLKFCHLDFFIWTQRYFQASLVIYPSIHPFIYPSIHLSIHPPIYPGIHPSRHPFIHSRESIKNLLCAQH